MKHPKGKKKKKTKKNKFRNKKLLNSLIQYHITRTISFKENN